MHDSEALQHGMLSQQVSFRARVTGIDGAGTVSVKRSDAEAVFSCDVLHSALGTGSTLETDDEVLVWSDDAGGARPVIVGRIGRVPVRAVDVPDEIVIEARKNLTLKCGEGSITIREDGRILIKGRDLVAHARRLNRIRGGAVAIN